MKKQLPGWAVLLIITLVAGLALGVTYSLTEKPIAEQAVIQAENARKTVMPDADSFSELTLEEGASIDWAYAGLKTVEGKQVPLTLNDIDAIAGATYTSQAVVDAINKAETNAKRNMFSIPIVGTTIPHEIVGVFGCGKVLLMPAEEGTGVIAGGPVRAVLEMSGIKDIRAKSLGSNNPINCAKATIAGLKALRTAEQVAALRGLSVEEVSSLTLVDKK